MSADVVAVFEAAESLPAEQRRELIELLAAGLDDEPVPPLSEAWWRVIEHRSAEYAAGRAETVPCSEVLARWRHGSLLVPMPGPNSDDTCPGQVAVLVWVDSRNWSSP